MSRVETSIMKFSMFTKATCPFVFQAALIYSAAIIFINIRYLMNIKNEDYSVMLMLNYNVVNQQED